MGASTRFAPEASVFSKRPANAGDTTRLMTTIKTLQADVEKLTRERDEARKQVRDEQLKAAQQRQRFFAMFTALKSAFEQTKSS